MTPAPPTGTEAQTALSGPSTPDPERARRALLPLLAVAAALALAGIGAIVISSSYDEPK